LLSVIWCKRTVTVCMQPSPRETRVAITELHMSQYSTYKLRRWRRELLQSLISLPQQYYSCQIEERSNHPNVCGIWRCGRELSPIQYVMAFILGNGPLNSKVNVYRILMTNMNQNWSFPFHTKFCCLSLRYENNMWPGLSIWSEYFHEPLTESWASKL